ncbi:11-beta-hydroxysteroid dehydrogenase-like 4A isoform X3 [Ziziphus jujuba]|uniref:11-beta-hydroxysteroid dehydrogenase-like 4A isoform X3 n=1 Tax=Ziziphus jujuba TaxID=326968 RepID=A0ABM4A0C0_ZIZJJ|nr:11-beta-hydroxysteroid dehydrogenase-like 4A isoform X3 [Ziziphus jujuba]
MYVNGFVSQVDEHSTSSPNTYSTHFLPSTFPNFQASSFREKIHNFQRRRFWKSSINHRSSFWHWRVDHLVNNAGIARDGVFKNVEQISDIVPVMDVNFWGTVYSTHFALPHLLKAKGKIVVIASTCGWYPLPRLIIYNASKAALISFFDTLRAELGWDIGITIVTPGVIKTKLTQGDLLQPVPAESAEGCAKAIVKSACRGDMYLTEPSWIRVLVPLKVFCPELVDIGNRWFSRLKIKSSFLSSQSQLKVE